MLPANTDKSVLARYMELEQPLDRIQAKYVWIDGSGESMRAKTRTLDFDPKKAEGKHLIDYFTTQVSSRHGLWHILSSSVHNMNP